MCSCALTCDSMSCSRYGTCLCGATVQGIPKKIAKLAKPFATRKSRQKVSPNLSKGLPGFEEVDAQLQTSLGQEDLSSGL